MGCGFILMQVKKERKKKKVLNDQVGVCSECCVRELPFFLGHQAALAFCPKQ